jgi:sugar O-acyltransferase (sialic acid O-acetyltransferase NeuD family)
MHAAFIGYGELGEQVHALIQQAWPGVQPVFFDDELFAKKAANAFPFSSYDEEKFKDYSFIICLGYKRPNEKQQILQHLNRTGRKAFSFCHATCFVSPTAMIGEGAIVYPMCNIDKEVKIGNGVLLNNSVTVSHNAVIGDCCYLSPGVVLSGYVTVGEKTFIGAGAVVANNVRIGNNVIIGIGTVVTKDVPDNSFVIGNPMQFVKNLQLS